MPDPAQRRILCPGCQTVLALPPKLTAKRLACPKCKTIVDPATAADAPAVRTEPKGEEPKRAEAKRDEAVASEKLDLTLDLDFPAPVGAPTTATSPTPVARTVSQTSPQTNAKSGDAHVPVVCFVCGTRYYALAKNIGSQAKCPDCFSMNEVRAPRERPKQTLGPGLTPSSDSGADIGLTAPESTPGYRPMFRDTPKPESGVGPGQAKANRADDGPIDLSLPDISSQSLTASPPMFRASDHGNNPASPTSVTPIAPIPSAPQAKPKVELVDPMVDSVARRRELDAKKPKSPQPDDDEEGDDFRLSEPVERTGFSEKFAREIVDEAKRPSAYPKPVLPPAVPPARPPGPITFGVAPVPPSTPSASSPPPAPMSDSKRWRVDDPAPASPVKSDDPLDLESMAQALPSANRVTAPVVTSSTATAAPPATGLPPDAPLDDDPLRNGIQLRRGMTVQDLAEKYEPDEPEFDPYKYKFELPKSHWLLLQPKVMIRWFICGALVAAFFAMIHYGLTPPAEEFGTEPVIRSIVGIISIIVFLVAFGYLANCCYFLAEISANDHKTVDEWPAAGLIDSAMNALFIFAGIFWSGVATALLSVVVSVVTGSALLSGLVALLIWPSVFFLFPPVYVAMLEAGSVSTPMTKNVLLAIRRRPGPWISHYLATVGYFLVMLIAVALFWFYGFSLTYLLAGIVVSGAWLLYFEQLGKLARVVSNTITEIAAEEARREAAE